MAASKSTSNPQNGVTLAAASTFTSNQQSSGDIDLTAAYGAIITTRIKNGATGPTVAAFCLVEVSFDGTTYTQFALVQGGSTNFSATGGTGGIPAGQFDFTFFIPPQVSHARVTFFGNTGQAVTVSSWVEALTG